MFVHKNRNCLIKHFHKILQQIKGKRTAYQNKVEICHFLCYFFKKYLPDAKISCRAVVKLQTDLVYSGFTRLHSNYVIVQICFRMKFGSISTSENSSVKLLFSSFSSYYTQEESNKIIFHSWFKYIYCVLIIFHCSVDQNQMAAWSIYKKYFKTTCCIKSQ